MSKFKTRVRKGRIVDGIINIDKPLGYSSNKALQKVKYLLQAQKAGHTGALDPLASGVLPLCFGQATKISSYLLDSDKRYQATLQLGSVTNTGDKEGEIIRSVDVLPFSDDVLEQLIKRFLGKQTQIPPMHSAVKHEGQPLYKLARKGHEIERKAREIQIYELAIIEYSHPFLTIDVKCSKGTYIRTLAEDMGEALGCGAHLAALRRTEAGPFNLDSAFTIEEVTEAIERQAMEEVLLPADLALQCYQSIYLTMEQHEDIKFGRQILLTEKQFSELNFVPETSHAKHRIYSSEGTFLGLGDIHWDERDFEQLFLRPKKMFF